VIASGVDEGFSGKAKLTGRKAYGLRTPQGIEIAILQPMGKPYPSRNVPTDSAEEAEIQRMRESSFAAEVPDLVVEILSARGKSHP